MKTKKSILVVAIFLSLSLASKAQITLEHVYDSAATGAGQLWCTSTFSQLMIINFEVSGERYVKINRCGSMIEIYDMSHHLVKTISLATLPRLAPYGFLSDILYLSEQLFNTDSKIEFMYVYEFTDSSGYAHEVTSIYNEDVTLLFTDTSGPWVHPNWEMQQWPIYNTSAGTGTKMILSDQYSGKAKVFALPGTLSTCTQQGNAQLMQEQAAARQLGNLYPNPGNGMITLPFELPGGEKEGEIILFNTLGTAIKRYKVDDTIRELRLDNTQLPAGTYYYQLQTSHGTLEGRKMIVVK